MVEQVETLKHPLVNCPFCTCIFVTESDLRLHKDRFSWIPEIHHARWSDELARRKRNFDF